MTRRVTRGLRSMLPGPIAYHQLSIFGRGHLAKLDFNRSVPRVELRGDATCCTRAVFDAECLWMSSS